MRFGSITQSSSFDGEQAYWRCMGCMTTKVCQNAVEMHGGLASVPGYEALDASKWAATVHMAHGSEAPRALTGLRLRCLARWLGACDPLAWACPRCKAPALACVMSRHLTSWHLIA